MLGRPFEISITVCFLLSVVVIAVYQKSVIVIVLCRVNQSVKKVFHNFFYESFWLNDQLVAVVYVLCGLFGVVEN